MKYLSHRPYVELLFAAGLLVTTSMAAQSRMKYIDPSLPEYKPQQVQVPKDRGYVMRDGSIRIVGFDDMAGIIARWNALFENAPGSNSRRSSRATGRRYPLSPMT